MISKERYYINAKGEVCTESDTSASYLLVGKGSEIEDRDVAKYGFVDGLIKSKEQKPLLESKEAPKAEDKPKTKEEPQNGK